MGSKTTTTDPSIDRGSVKVPSVARQERDPCLKAPGVGRSPGRPPKDPETTPNKPQELPHGEESPGCSQRQGSPTTRWRESPLTLQPRKGPYEAVIPLHSDRPERNGLCAGIEKITSFSSASPPQGAPE